MSSITFDSANTSNSTRKNEKLINKIYDKQAALRRQMHSEHHRQGSQQGGRNINQNDWATGRTKRTDELAGQQEPSEKDKDSKARRLPSWLCRGDQLRDFCFNVESMKRTCSDH